jgi:hypothetical protein
MSTALDRPPQQTQVGTEGGSSRDSFLAEAFLRPADNAVAGMLGSTAKTFSAPVNPSAPKCVETDNAGAVVALNFNTANIYQNNAKEADKRFDTLVAA